MNLDKNSKIGIAGAGAMGSGIAQVAASAGHKVFLIDNDRAVLEKSRQALANVMKRLIEKGKVSEKNAEEIKKQITYSLDLQYLEHCDFIIEAVVENIEVKKELFSSIEKVVREDCVLASNTSSLSIASLASVLKNKERMLGVHFFNPAALMPLVEVIPAFTSSEAVAKEVMKLVSAWGKTCVQVKDTPGFIVNRLARPFYGEAIRIYEEGIADFATIDAIMKEVGGFKMGPFELMDFIGNDVNFKVSCSVFEQFFYDPRYKPSITQQRLYESGNFGRKSGRGYYNYSVPAHDELNTYEPELGNKIFLRILSMLINEAVDALNLSIASRDDLDTAMKKGVNYPKGLLEWADEIGLATVLTCLNDLQEEYGEDRYRPSPLLKKMLREKRNFYS